MEPLYESTYIEVQTLKTLKHKAKLLLNGALEPWERVVLAGQILDQIHRDFSFMTIFVNVPENALERYPVLRMMHPERANGCLPVSAEELAIAILAQALENYRENDETSFLARQALEKSARIFYLSIVGKTGKDCIMDEIYSKIITALAAICKIASDKKDRPIADIVRNLYADIYRERKDAAARTQEGRHATARAIFRWEVSIPHEVMNSRHNLPERMKDIPQRRLPRLINLRN